MKLVISAKTYFSVWTLTNGKLKNRQELNNLDELNTYLEKDKANLYAAILRKQGRVKFTLFERQGNNMYKEKKVPSDVKNMLQKMI